MPQRLLVVLLVVLPATARAAPPDFDREVAPLLAARCLDCHRGPKPKGGLDLSRKAGVLGGDAPAVVPGKPDESELWNRIATDEMPPKKPLSEGEKRVLREWIAGGAKWGTDPIDPFRFTTPTRAGYDWWSLRTLNRPPVPDVPHPRPRTLNPIDAFVLAKLGDKGLSLSPPADRRTLIRRVAFDLTGLPPTPEEVETFLNDARPDAYEKVVDRLLASPHYGERWARHWLDVVRFGETDGFERNSVRPNAWHYRDWVIRTLNDDVPYDEFARLQLAGDVLRPSDPDATKATGFLVAGVHNTVLGNDQMRAIARQDELEDLVGSVGQTFLGLTANCARCHDHKFDPIPQADYYRLASALSGVGHGERWLAEPVWNHPGEKAYAVVPQNPGIARLLLRGDVNNPSEVVAPGGLRAVPGVVPDFGLPPDAPDADRRRKLAEWVSSPHNPLFARVIVNRVWHYHFGAGLVDTPNDLGFNGGRPSHPELLDRLAAEFRDNGLSLKKLHRLIVTSAAYRQASSVRKDALALDADNRLLWRYRPRRLEGEAVRDSMLAASGLLNPQVGGKGFSDYRERNFNGTAYFDPIDPVGPEFHRRSIYRFVPRGGNQGLLDTFDCPDPAAAAPRRAVTTTPLQALALWNSGFALRAADAFAARVEKEAPGDSAKQIRRAWQLAYQRDPTAEEAKLAAKLVADHGLRPLCRALFNSNEFLTVE
jgi:hypothetical protein